jgi:hypothetical protein
VHYYVRSADFGWYLCFTLCGIAFVKLSAFETGEKNAIAAAATFQ